MKNNSKKQSKKSKQAKDESESCFVLTAQFSCRTEAQCKELSKILQAAFEKQVDIWCGREPKESMDFAEKLDAIKRTGLKAEFTEDWSKI